MLNGFLDSGDPTSGDVEDWLADESAAQQRSTAKWVEIAGVSGLIAMGAGVIAAAAAILALNVAR